MNREKHNLLAYITQVSFAMDDTVLFLDTHPCDKDALCYYNKLKKERKEAVLKSIDEQGKLTEEIVKALEVSETLTEVEDRPVAMGIKNKLLLFIMDF